MIALAREHLSALEHGASALPETLRPAFLPLADECERGQEDRRAGRQARDVHDRRKQPDAKFVHDRVYGNCQPNQKGQQPGTGPSRAVQFA